jgi:hypothetical protein
LDLPGLLSVRVGPRRTSHAAFFIRDQTEVDQLLRTLVDLGKQQ